MSTITLELRPDGPYSDAHTVQVARHVAEAVRVLNHATASHAETGVTAPATVYDVLGALRTAVEGLPSLFTQLTRYLNKELEAGRLADHVRDPAYAVGTAERELQDADAVALPILQDALERAQRHINGLYIPDAGGGSAGGGA